MSDSDEPERGFADGIASSKGDPRVLLLLNAIISTMFAWTVVGGLSILGVVEFSALNVATGAIVVFALTYLVVSS